MDVWNEFAKACMPSEASTPSIRISCRGSQTVQYARTDARPRWRHGRPCKWMGLLRPLASQRLHRHGRSQEASWYCLRALKHQPFCVMSTSPSVALTPACGIPHSLCPQNGRGLWPRPGASRWRPRSSQAPRSEAKERCRRGDHGPERVRRQGRTL